MLTIKEAIERRRSIRRFKPDPVPEECLRALLEAARLAPSGCNAQPWRFKIVTSPETRAELARAAYDQAFVAQAPVVIVCCADIKGYLQGTVSGIQDLGAIKAVEDRVVKILVKRAREMETLTLEEVMPKIAFNVGLAVEHMVLRALDFGLGTCWVRLVDGRKVKELFGWEEHLQVVALLPLGYPDEAPGPRKRLDLEDLLIP